MDDFNEDLIEEMFSRWEGQTSKLGIPASAMLEEGENFAIMLQDEINTRLNCYKADGER